ncbi:MAG: lipopolysaccharide biosynthesis protein [Oscillospiraceae bacterium]|nr:lipopolysaccharide biosynthesis protein [Oscillospiraceae bacterium]
MGLSTLISLVYTPVMISRLGDSEYGVYQSVLPIVSYLNLLSLGLGSAYVRYYSRAKVADDRKLMARLNGMFLVTFSVLGLLCLVIGFTLSFHGDVIFGSKVTAEEVALGEKLLRIMTVNSAIYLPLSVFNSHITIHERYLFQKIVAMGKQVLNPLLMIPLLILGFRSVTLTVLTLTFTVATGIVDIYYCFVRLRMRVSFRKYDFGLMRQMFGFTAYVFLGIVVDNFNWAIDRLLLLWFHGSAAVTIYTVAAQLNVYYQSFSAAVTNVLTPRVHRIVAEKRPDWELDSLFIRAARLQFMLLSGILLGFVAVGQTFVVRWAGGERFAVDYYTTIMLFLASIWTNTQLVGYEILRAKGLHKFSSLLCLIVAVGNVIISIPLCIRWQGLGAAVGTMLSSTIGSVILNRYFYRRAGLNIPRFWRRISHLLPGMAVPLIVAVLIAVFAPISGYPGVVFWGIVFMAVYVGSLWLFGMSRYEREMVSGPVRRIWRQIKR